MAIYCNGSLSAFYEKTFARRIARIAPHAPSRFGFCGGLFTLGLFRARPVGPNLRRGTFGGACPTAPSAIHFRQTASTSKSLGHLNFRDDSLASQNLRRGTFGDEPAPPLGAKSEVEGNIASTRSFSVMERHVDTSKFKFSWCRTTHGDKLQELASRCSLCHNLLVAIKTATKY